MRLVLIALAVFLAAPAFAQEAESSVELQAWYLCVGHYVQEQRNAASLVPTGELVNAGMKACAAEEAAYMQALKAVAPKIDHEKVMVAMRQEVASGLTQALDQP